MPTETDLFKTPNILRQASRKQTQMEECLVKHVQPFNKGLNTCACMFMLLLAKLFKVEPRMHCASVGSFYVASIWIRNFIDCTQILH